MSSPAPPVTYLFSEDEEIIGFVPFTQSDRNRHRFLGRESGKEKPRITDRGVKRQHATIETLQRIQDILCDGEVITNEETVLINARRQGGKPSFEIASGNEGRIQGEEPTMLVEETWLEGGTASTGQHGS